MHSSDESWAATLAAEVLYATMLTILVGPALVVLFGMVPALIWDVAAPPVVWLLIVVPFVARVAYGVSARKREERGETTWWVDARHVSGQEILRAGSIWILVVFVVVPLWSATLISGVTAGFLVLVGWVATILFAIFNTRRRLGLSGPGLTRARMTRAVLLGAVGFFVFEGVMWLLLRPPGIATFVRDLIVTALFLGASWIAGTRLMDSMDG